MPEDVLFFLKCQKLKQAQKNIVVGCIRFKQIWGMNYYISWHTLFSHSILFSFQRLDVLYLVVGWEIWKRQIDQESETRPGQGKQLTNLVCFFRLWNILNILVNLLNYKCMALALFKDKKHGNFMILMWIRILIFRVPKNLLFYS